MFIWDRSYSPRSITAPWTVPAKNEKSLPLDLVLTPLKGGSESLEALLKKRPKGVLFHLWATWCPPCVEEFPSIEQLYRQSALNPELPLVIAVSVDENKELIADFVKKLGFEVTVPIYWDGKGKSAELLDTSQFPETFLIQAGGKVGHRWIGPQNWLSQNVLAALR